MESEIVNDLPSTDIFVLPLSCTFDEQLLTQSMFLQSAKDAFERHGILIRIQDGKILCRGKDVVQFRDPVEGSGHTILKSIRRSDSIAAYLTRRSQAKLFMELYDF